MKIGIVLPDASLEFCKAKEARGKEVWGSKSAHLKFRKVHKRNPRQINHGAGSQVFIAKLNWFSPTL
jgi:hypothetical protein